MRADEFPVGMAIEGAYRILPRDIQGVDVSGNPFISRFGWAELEYFAKAFILRCQVSNLWAALIKDEYTDLCCRYLLSGYHFFDDDHDEGDVQPFLPTGRDSGRFFLLDRGLFICGDDGKYRVTERFIRFCSWCKQRR